MGETAEAINAVSSAVTISRKRLDWSCQLCESFGSIHHPNLEGPLLIELLNEVHAEQSPRCAFPIYSLSQDGIDVRVEFLSLKSEDFERAQRSEARCPYPD